MTRHAFTIEIAAPPETVFDIWVDLDRIPEWTEGLTRVTDRVGPAGRAGTRYKAWFGRAAARVEVLVGERPRRYDWRVRLGPLVAEFTTELVDSGTGTRLTETVRTRGLLGAIWSGILSTGSWKGSFRGELATFARICEGREPPRP